MEDLDNNKSIPLLRGPANMMMLGPNGANFANAAVRIHPVDRMQRVCDSGRPLDIDMVRNIYGSGLAMRLATERRMASHVGGRVLGSYGGCMESRVMLETVTGTDTIIDFTDILGRPCDNPTAGNGVETAHLWMERKLQL